VSGWFYFVADHDKISVANPIFRFPVRGQ